MPDDTPELVYILQDIATHHILHVFRSEQSAQQWIVDNPKIQYITVYAEGNYRIKPLETTSDYVISSHEVRDN